MKYFIFLLFPVLVSCSEHQQNQGFRDYQTQKITRIDTTLAREFSATIRGRQDIDILPEVAGKITKVCVLEGQKVKAGQTLFIIDQVPYNAALLRAKANVQAAQSASENARISYESKKKLREEGVISDFELSTSENAWKTAQATEAQADAALINAQHDFDHTTVNSPADGVVGTIPFREGTLVSPQMHQPLTTISDNSKMYVYFSINENILLDFIQKSGSKEQTIKNFPPISLKLSNNTIYNLKGKIESISGVINPQTGTVQLRAIFENPDEILHSGASGAVILPEDYSNCTIIPKSATFEVQDKIFVYRVDSLGCASSQMIQVTPSTMKDKYIVTAGLDVDTQIVTEGVALIHEGQQVKH